MSDELEPPVAILRSGDILVIGHRRGPFSQADADEYRARVLDRVPGLADVVLLSDLVGLAAFRPDEVKAADTVVCPPLTLEALLEKLHWSREQAEHFALSGCELCGDSPDGWYWCADARELPGRS